MFGKAILEIPQSGDIRPSRTEGLSDALAMRMGRIAAETLSEHDGPVVVWLEDGRVKYLRFVR
jgi:hypothetical protein